LFAPADKARHKAAAKAENNLFIFLLGDLSCYQKISIPIDRSMGDMIFRPAAALEANMPDRIHADKMALNIRHTVLITERTEARQNKSQRQIPTETARECRLSHTVIRCADDLFRHQDENGL
jgi:hypothetical protein